MRIAYLGHPLHQTSHGMFTRQSGGAAGRAGAARIRPGSNVRCQEDRFRLQTGDGRSILLTLKPRTNAPMEDIESYAESGETVIAEYTGEPEAGAVAVKVRNARGER